MKKFFSLLIAVFILIGSVSYAESLTIVTTSYPFYCLAKSFTEDYAEVILDEEGSRTDGDILFCVEKPESWKGDHVVSAADLLKMIDGETDVLTTPQNASVLSSNLLNMMVEMDAEKGNACWDKWFELFNALNQIQVEIGECVNAETKITCNDGSMAYFAEAFGVTVSEDGIVLSAFNKPTEEEMKLSFVELMQKNVEALKKGNEK